MSTTLNDQLIEASKHGDLEKVKELVENGADIHAQDDHALCWSANNGQLDVVKYLVENGADIHAYNDDALRLSAEKSNIDLVKYLVENGANIHADNDYALRLSALHGHLNVVKYLVENGANQSILFELWDNQKIVNVFIDIPDCNPDEKHTDELCSDSFKLPNKGNWHGR